MKFGDYLLAWPLWFSLCRQGKLTDFTFAFPALFSSWVSFSILQSALPSWQTGGNFDQCYSLRVLACNFSPHGLMAGSWLL